MKYSDDTEEHRKAHIDYIDVRWKQLYGLEAERADEGIKYLLFVNAGAAAAVLAFHGSVAAVRDMLWPKFMLGFFVMGVILVGLVHITRHRHAANLFREWRVSVADYFSDKKGWQNIIDEDNKRANRIDIALIAAYTSFSFFVIGVFIGVLNFATLTSGDSNVRKEASASANPAQAIRAESSVNQGRSTAHERRDAEQPTSSTGSKKEVSR